VEKVAAVLKAAELNAAVLQLLAHLRYWPAKQVRIVSRVKIVVAKKGAEQSAAFSPHTFSSRVVRNHDCTGCVKPK
jgi:hypothetical protein